MENVKLPKRICDLLDQLFEDKKSLGDDAKYYVIWYCLQVPTYIYLDKKYIELNEFSNKVTNTEKIVNAILYGYEPEETEEERKERELRENFELIVHNYLLARVKRESEIVRYSKEITDMFFQYKK